MCLYNVCNLAPSAITIKNFFLLILCIIYFNSNANYDENFTLLDTLAPEVISTTKAMANKKKLTIIFYFAGVNNLGFFLRKNLAQISKWGSNQDINILVQLDALLSGNKKVTKRYFIAQDKLVLLNSNDPATQSMDSGDPQSLLGWCTYCIQNFPAQHYVLGLSNHATGIIDIGQIRALNPSELFIFNPTTNLIELNRNQPFLERISQQDPNRGLFFDDITGHYLTNAQLDAVLKTVCTKHLKKKFDVVIFDACLQQMYEIATYMKNYAHIMLGSEEVILAPGLNYEDVLTPLFKNPTDFVTFAAHTANSYEMTYKKITQDYTFSALDLDLVQELEENINTVALLLIDGLSKKKNLLRDIIKTSRHKKLCTCFNEPSYIDLGHFYQNLLNNLVRFSPKAEHDPELSSLFKHLIASLKEGNLIIKHLAIANVAGTSLSQSQGISIYFPEFGNKHASYSYQNPWSVFLDYYLHFA